MTKWLISLTIVCIGCLMWWGINSPVENIPIDYNPEIQLANSIEDDALAEGWVVIGQTDNRDQYATKIYKYEGVK